MNASIWLDPASTALGYGGAGLIALAYFLNQHGTLPSNNWRFPAINLSGSLLVLGSLLTHPNAPSIAIEAFWSSISLYGLLRSRRRDRLDGGSPGG